MKKIVHYINQFFAGIGGEDKADHEPELVEGVKGPGMALNSFLTEGKITHTIICGDNFMGSNTKDAIERIKGMLDGIEFDMLIAGPSFQAGRYGVACGNICKAIKEDRNIPVITSANIENPAVEMFKAQFPIFKGGHSAAEMRNDCKAMAEYANKILRGEKTLSANEEGYFERGIRHQTWVEGMKPAARRGVEMLIKKLNGEEFKTELVVPAKDKVDPASPIKDLKNAKIALLTTGGIVPVDNPDRIQSASATRWGRYDISGMDRLKAGEFKTIHAGFDPAAANADPNVIMPVDVMKEMLNEGLYGSLHNYFYSTVGTGTTQAEAARMGKEIVEKLKEDGVNGVIMTST